MTDELPPHEPREPEPWASPAASDLPLPGAEAPAQMPLSLTPPSELESPEPRPSEARPSDPESPSSATPATPADQERPPEASLPEPVDDPETPDEDGAPFAAANRPPPIERARRFNWPTPPALPFPWTASMAVLSGVVTLTFLMFLGIEPTPRWLLLVGAGAAALGTDGTLRATWREPFASGADTTPSLFLPALYVFAAPILIEHNVGGYAAMPCALLAGVGFAAILVAEVLSVRTGAPLYSYARLVTSGATYFVAFTLLAMTSVLNPSLPAALIATWLICVMLGIELLREGEVDPLETALFSSIAALVVMQARWLLFFLPVEGYLAGLALLIAFFLTVGLLHAHVTRQLTGAIAAEYVAVAALGLAVVVAARTAGVA